MASAFAESALPSGTGAQREAARARLRALRDEARRLERLGLERPLARCHEQIRYWSFVTALLSLPPVPAPVPARFGDSSWPDASR